MRDRAEKIGRILEDAGYAVDYPPDTTSCDDRPSGVQVIVGAETSEAPASTNDGATPRQDQARYMESMARLAGGIAHDFNNILAVISICAEDVLDGLEGVDRARECLVDIQNAVRRAHTLTRDLLSFSGRSMNTPSVVPIDEVIARLEPMISPALDASIRLGLSLDAAGALVRIDPEQWASVFLNLAIHARQAMPSGGSLMIRTRELFRDAGPTSGLLPGARAAEPTRGRWVEIDVTDTGAGIPEPHQSRVFEPFFCPEGVGKPNGLGLAVVHGIVAQSGGFIELMSRVGVGTTFRLYLPRADDARESGPGARSRPLPEGEPASGSPPSSRKLAKEPPTSAPQRASPPERARRSTTVLLVEDEDVLRKSAHRALEQHGYHVIHARSAEDALALLPSLPRLDLLVTDVVLPGMDGRALATRIVELYPGTAVLYASGYTDDEVLRVAVEKAETFFLQKPYTSKVLVRRVQEVLAKAPARRA